MFGFFKKKTAEQIESEAIKSYKADNLKLIAKIGVLESSNRSLKDERDMFDQDLTKKEREIDDLKERVADLEAELEAAKEDQGKKVTYATARKSLTKAKLKELRKALDAVPGHAGFGGTVSVYDKKKKTLKNVELKTKQEALDILSKAEKGDVDIVL